jgi:hypothetical protein
MHFKTEFCYYLNVIQDLSPVKTLPLKEMSSSVHGTARSRKGENQNLRNYPKLLLVFSICEWKLVFFNR